MKNFAFVILFAAAAINFMSTDMRTVEIAQAQQGAADVMVASR